MRLVVLRRLDVLLSVFTAWPDVCPVVRVWTREVMPRRVELVVVRRVVSCSIVEVRRSLYRVPRNVVLRVVDPAT